MGRVKAGMNFLRFRDKKELANALAQKVAFLLNESLLNQKNASIVVSGGKSPIEFFKSLSKTKINWERVLVTLADERMVDKYSKDSNERLVRDYLLKNEAKSAKFISLTLKTCSSLPSPFDVVVLGMGPDGHCASLFPCAKELKEATDLRSKKSCIMITPLNAPYTRITLTLPRLLDARHIILSINGRDKEKVFKKALEDGPNMEMPIRYFLRQKDIPLSIYYSP